MVDTPDPYRAKAQDRNREIAEAWLKANFGTILYGPDGEPRRGLENSLTATLDTLADRVAEEARKARDLEWLAGIKLHTLPGHKDTIPVALERIAAREEEARKAGHPEPPAAVLQTIRTLRAEVAALKVEIANRDSERVEVVEHLTGEVNALKVERREGHRLVCNYREGAIGGPGCICGPKSWERAEARLERLRGAAQAFLAKLTEVESAISWAFVTRPYAGPNYATEKSALLVALSPPDPQEGK